MKTLLAQTAAGLRVLVVLTVLLGVVYPLGVWLVDRLPGLQANAEGSLVSVNGTTVGSDLMGIDPKAANPGHDPWFHTRPSAVNGDPSTSGASNKAADNPDYIKVMQQRKTTIAAREGVDPAQVPPDAVTASASGLDADISPAYAALQAPRVARANGLPLARVLALVEANTTGRGLGFVGEPRVDVLMLNLAVRAAGPGAH
ncbi:potassium-transporting ATPase subunit C [Labedaea rhizosphaerae]|uniref:Potassium-transporting ATPase KdpC subunit n=1 Tax=Labedaea rhizosphaerae TaxID=598644 RepID=A0A4R6SF26_LABRH|nr:potassium-transporting ATPase subunit C [Labedaea rhizosphaerae]TDQ00572.1 K+-transporting ATPase ATPase C chain [Labedaea rhizosphaerae]